MALTVSCLRASQCLKIIGTMVLTASIVKWALWRLRPFQTGFLRQWDSDDSNQLICITSGVSNSLFWWLQHKNLLMCHSIAPVSWVMVRTDASGAGWGAHCKTQLAQGRWDLRLHNPGLKIPELRAAFCALRTFSHLLKGESASLRMDNTTAVSYLKRQGGSSPCPGLTHRI